jgi:hypothetical protein
MDADTPIACTLSAVDYQRRLRAIRRVGFEAFLSADERPDGATLRFRNSEEVRQQLDSIVEAERACCPFLSLTVDDAGGELVIGVTAPSEAQPVVRDLILSFRGEERP